MEKETLLSGFNQRIGNPDATTGMYGDTGVSGRTINAYLDTILPSITDDGMVTDAFYDSHVNILKAMGGQMRHEQSEFVKSYKPSPNNPNPNSNPASPESKWEERLKAIESERALEKKGVLIQGLRQGAFGKAAELKVSNKNLWEDAVRLVDYKDDMTAEDMVSKAKTVYEAKLKAYLGDGAVPYGGEQKGGSPQVSSEEANAKREAFRQKMVAQGRLPEKTKD